MESLTLHDVSFECVRNLASMAGDGGEAADVIRAPLLLATLLITRGRGKETCTGADREGDCGRGLGPTGLKGTSAGLLVAPLDSIRVHGRLSTSQLITQDRRPGKPDLEVQGSSKRESSHGEPASAQTQSYSSKLCFSGAAAPSELDLSADGLESTH